MSILADFIGRRAKAPKQPIANAGAVTRDEFNTLNNAVATLGRAVELLIEDHDTVLSDDKLKAMVNSAFAELKPSLTPKRTPGTFLAPAADDDGPAPIANKAPRGPKPPAANDLSRLAPAAD